MTPTEQYVVRLEALQEGERSRLRRLGGMPLDETVAGFDLFTGLWWPLREASKAAPRRSVAWLAAKLFGSLPLPHVAAPGRGAALARILGAEERRARDRKSARGRFDALLRTPLEGLEPHLGWALSVVGDAVRHGRAEGLDWVRLIDDLSVWDRAVARVPGGEVRDVWAEDYLSQAGLL